LRLLASKCVSTFIKFFTNFAVRYYFPAQPVRSFDN
jgi:hypothetical protein